MQTTTWQPTIECALVRCRPLTPDDFEALYAVASDPLIWEQHPNRDRYQREVFATYFRGAIESNGALLVVHKESGAIMGSSRFYDFAEGSGGVAGSGPRCVSIGYTFIARKYWGGEYNRALKGLMLSHAFQFVERVVFHVGVNNRRSRRAMEKLGAKLVGETDISYYGEPSNLNAVYWIDKADRADVA